MTVVSGINVKCLQDWSFDFCSQQITPQTALKWYHKDSSLPTMLWFVNWPGSRRCWRSCARSPGKSAGSSGREPRSRAAPCTSHGGPSLRSIATGERSKWYFQRMMISFPLTLFFFYLALDGVPCVLQPGVVVCGVEHQPFFQIPTCIFTHLDERVKRWMKIWII